MNAPELLYVTPSSPSDPLLAYAVFRDPVSERSRALFGSPAYSRFYRELLAGFDFPCYGPGEGSPRGVTADNINPCPPDYSRGTLTQMSVPALDPMALAQALIATGQLTLGPEAFQTPAAAAALGQALAITGTASPTGGSMSAPWFGLGGSFTGGSTPILPFGFGAGTSGPFLPDAAGGSGGGLIDLIGTIAGVGGQFFLQQQAAKQQEELLKQQLRLLQAAGMAGAAPMGFTGAAAGSLLPAILGGGAGGLMGGLVQGGADMLSALFGGAAGPACGPRPPVQAPSLFRMGCGGKPSLPARQQVVGPDGNLYIVASLGRATRGSREEGTMRRLARQNGFTVARKGSGRRGGRRRPR